MKLSLLVVAITLLGACSTGARRVACDRHLVPINPPAVTAAAAPRPEHGR